MLSLNFRNNGHHLTTSVGQQIEITLGTVGPKQYGEPHVSSPAIQLESIALGWPALPSGPTFTYIFEATAEGESQITLPIIYSENPDLTKQLTFTVTIQVAPATKNLTAPRKSMTPDQANTKPWKNAWTNLNNAVQQTFVPSLPRLTRVQVELVVANPSSRQWRGYDDVDECSGRSAGGCIEDRASRRMWPRSFLSSQGRCTSFAGAGL